MQQLFDGWHFNEVEKTFFLKMNKSFFLGCPHMSIGYKYERAVHKTNKRTHVYVSLTHDEMNL
jgi:hypothetical protein